MSYFDKEKMANTCDQTIGLAGARAGAPTQQEQAEKNMFYHSDMAMKAEKAAKFFKAHPEFDEFINLIRNGSIQI